MSLRRRDLNNVTQIILKSKKKKKIDFDLILNIAPQIIPTLTYLSYAVHIYLITLCIILLLHVNNWIIWCWQLN